MSSEAASPETPSSGTPPPETPEGTTSESRRDVPRTIALAVVGVLALVAVVAAVWFGYGWGGVLVDRMDAAPRDAALSDAQRAAIALNSIDPRDVDGSIEQMRSSITGALADDLTANEQAIRDRVAQDGTGLSSEVLFGTLTNLDTDADTAQALIVLKVRRQVPGAFADNKLTVNVAMQKDGDSWKAVTLEPLGTIEMGHGPTDEEGNPVPAAPAPAEPAPENPAPENPAPENPAPENPAPENPAPENAGVPAP